MKRCGAVQRRLAGRARSGAARAFPVDPASAKRRALRASAAFLASAAMLLPASGAHAHAIGLSRGEYRATAEGLDVTLVLARGEVAVALPSLDVDGRGAIAERSLAAARAALARGTIEKIRVTSGQDLCTGTLLEASLTEQDGLEVRGSYRCPRSGEPATVTLAFLEDLSHGHRHAARVISTAGTTDHLLSRKQATFGVELNTAVSTGSPPPAARWRELVRMGVEHILTGYDHLLFLCALVLAGGTVRSLALAVTSFTVAHSVTLALAVLGVVVPPGRWVEPAIALSVVYVGLENFFPRRLARPWITFPFGLVHGFGFAGALGEVAIPRSDVPLALLSFNGGVELGQLAWIVVLGLLISCLERRHWFGRRAVFVLSAAIVAVGLVWFVGRLHDSGRDPGGVACAGIGCG